jgi:SMC interacting uncharacterized protein involved in chromosome segregation
VVNPAWRELDRQCRSIKTKLTRHQARFAALTLHPNVEGMDINKWEKQKANLQEQIEHLEFELFALKGQMQSISKHLKWEDLPQEHKFERLAPSRKRLADTVKRVAYRAETVMASIVREKLSHEDEARSLIRDLLRTDADIHPDEAAKVLQVRLHTMANPRSNSAVQHLLDHLNAAEFTYPGTNFRLIYTLLDPDK